VAGLSTQAVAASNAAPSKATDFLLMAAVYNAASRSGQLLAQMV